MARSLAEIQALYAAIPGVKNAYYQDPGDSSMEPPFIMIERTAPSDVFFANNIPHQLFKQYTVTVVVRDPRSEIPDLVEALPYTRLDRKFRTNGLHHFAFSVFF